MQEAAAVSVSSSDSREDAAADSGTVSSEETARDSADSEDEVRESANSADEVRESANSADEVRESANSEDSGSADVQRRTDGKFDAAVAAAAAAVTGSEVPAHGASGAERGS